MLSLDAIVELQRKLPFLKGWYVVFNTHTAHTAHTASGTEGVLVKDGNVLDVASIAE